MKEYLQQALKFADMLNRFRLVERMILVNGGEHRQENDVEHSYQLAMLAWYIVDSRKLDLDVDLVLRYAVVHDLVEVYAGDTYTYSADAENIASKESREADALERLRQEFAEFPDLFECIDRYEKKMDRESCFVYALDKIHPIINTYLDSGRRWKELDITVDVLYEDKKAKVMLSPEIEPYFSEIMRVLREEERDLFNVAEEPDEDDWEEIKSRMTKTS